MLEHLFVGDLLRCLWRKGARDIEALRASVDKGGYDFLGDNENRTLAGNLSDGLVRLAGGAS